MATVLMSEPCDDACDVEGEYSVTFGVDSMEMTDKDRDQMYADVLIVITWDGNVLKMMSHNEDAEEFKQTMTLTIHGTPTHFNKMLKFSPIMINLQRECTDLGTMKLPLSACFSDAVLCAAFRSQTVANTFKFVEEGRENATMNAFFRVQRELDDGTGETLYGTLQSKVKGHSDKRKANALANAKKLARKKKAMAEENEGGDGDDESDKDPCDDFACPGDLPDHCKRDLGLNQHVYRIVNGNLINVKAQIGPCGEVCPVPAKYIKELCKVTSNTGPPMSARFTFDETPKCAQLFDEKPRCACKGHSKAICPDCGGCLDGPIRVPRSAPATFQQRPCKDDWIDRNIKEEDLLKKLYDKYGVNVGAVKALGDVPEVGSYVQIKGKKKKGRKVKKSPPSGSACMESFEPAIPPTREKFIKLMKRKAPGRFCYDFGDNYPIPRSCSRVEKGAGDATVPKNMGWRWDSPIAGIERMKWYPGHVHPIVRCLMKNFLNPYPYDTIPVTRRDKHGRIVKTCNDFSGMPKINPALIQKPTLRIQRRDGEYFISMHPLKEKAKLENHCNPYLNCSPVTFKIKSDPKDIQKHRAKKLLRERGFSKNCHCEELECCRCKTEIEKKLLAYEMKTVSQQMKLKYSLEYADLEDSSDSEMNLEYTTPGAGIDERKCKPDVVHCETQYSAKDFTSPKVKPTVEPKVDKKSKSKSESKPRAQLKKPKTTRKMESIYIDPPCQPSVRCQPVNQCQPKCSPRPPMCNPNPLMCVPNPPMCNLRPTICNPCRTMCVPTQRRWC